MRLAWARHHVSAAGLVKSTREPVPHPPLGHERFAVGRANEVTGRRAGLVVRRRLPVQALGLGLRELVRVELPGVVVRGPRRIDHDRIERNLMTTEAVEVVEHVVLVLVDIAALPEPVSPLGQELWEAGPAAKGTQPAGGRSLAEERDAQRPSLGAGRYRSAVTVEVEAGPVGLGVDEDPVAAARDDPRHRRAIALRDPTLREHFRRAIRSRVAAVGAELDVAASLVELRRVPDAQAHEPLLGAPVPPERQSQGVVVGLE
jgi:hypothetical protein